MTNLAKINQALNNIEDRGYEGSRYVDQVESIFISASKELLSYGDEFGTNADRLKLVLEALAEFQN